MAGFKFGESTSFEANWESFLAEMEAVDSEMAAILRANKSRLSEVVHQGGRNAQARAEFNGAVMQALDGILARPRRDGS